MRRIQPSGRHHPCYLSGRGSIFGITTDKLLNIYPDGRTASISVREVTRLGMLDDLCGPLSSIWAGLAKKVPLHHDFRLYDDQLSKLKHEECV